LIVGGGVIGCAAAYYLRKKGVSVTVLEKKQIGEGGSSRNGGGVRQSGRDPRELPLAMYAVENLWPGLSEELGTNVEYCKKGNLRLAKTPAHLKILEGLTERARKCGLKVDMVDGDGVRTVNPYLSEEIIGASWCPTDGHANPMLTTLAFYKSARRSGARFVTGEKAAEIRKVKGRARAVITVAGNVYEAETIILAAGVESRPVLNKLGLDVPMRRVLLEALVTEIQPPMFEQMLGTAEADFYGHQSAHGSFVFGGSSGIDEYTSEHERPVNVPITAPCVCRGIINYIPALARVKIVRTWAGWIDECADHVPVLDFAEEAPGLIIACAFSGHGFGISPAVGKTLAELAVYGKSEIDISGLRYGRHKAKI
jgi:sarcosine oxidase subunit beta